MPGRLHETWRSGRARRLLPSAVMSGGRPVDPGAVTVRSEAVPRELASTELSASAPPAADRPPAAGEAIAADEGGRGPAIRIATLIAGAFAVGLALVLAIAHLIRAPASAHVVAGAADGSGDAAVAHDATPATPITPTIPAPVAAAAEVPHAPTGLHADRAVVDPRPTPRRSATNPARPDASARLASDASAPPSDQPATLTTPGRRLPAADLGDPGHAEVLRATIRGLGYAGYDPTVTAADVEAQHGTRRALALTRLAMVVRRTRGCAAARPKFVEASQVLSTDNGTDEALWSARAHMGAAVCALATGDPAAAAWHAPRAWELGDRDQASLVMALAAYERGDPRRARGLMMTTGQSRDPAVQAALRTWLGGTGLPYP